jgi:hypothetical protein
MGLLMESEWEYAAYGGTAELPKEPPASHALVHLVNLLPYRIQHTRGRPKTDERIRASRYRLAVTFPVQSRIISFWRWMLRKGGAV